MDRSLSILIVEDKRTQARTLNNQLNRLGYTIHSINSKGEDALKRLEERPADLVLMDIDLDGSLDGISTAKLIRQKWRIPLIFLTQHDDDLHFELAEETDPIAYLAKPYNFVNLHRIIQKCFAKKVQNEQFIQSTEDAYFIANTDGGYFRVELKQLAYTESSGPYQKLVFDDHEETICLNKKTLLHKLELSGLEFVEVNDRHIVNLNMVEKIDGQAIIVNAHLLPLSPLFSKSFYKKITFLSKSKKGK